MRDSDSSILCLHQGAELYGSDRSFLAAVEALAGAGATLDVILPADGELAAEVRKVKGVNLTFYSKGILRKRELKQPLVFVFNMLAGWLFYLQRFARHPIVYINTVVMFSALFAACFYRFSSKRIICHVREIPSGWQLVVFRTLFLISNVELVFNSKATQAAFRLPGRVIYNGVEQVTQPVEVQPRSLSGRPIHLLMIGRINEWKGQFFLVEALGLLPNEVLSRLQVRIVGSPFEGYEYLADDLQDKVEQAGLADVVTLLSFCQDPTEHYAWSDYVVVPSTLPEPFGRVAIEAFSFARPVIAAGHGGLTEIVEQGRSGFLFAPADQAALVQQICALAGFTDAEYASLCRGAHERFLQHFSIDGYRASLRALFSI